MDFMRVKIDCKRPEWVSAIAALACGTVTHSFALFNVIHNYDDILQQPVGYGSGITLGRWMLTLLGDFNTEFLGLGYNLPMVNGLTFILFIALSAALLVNTLKIRNRRSAALIGCLMSTFPTVCAAMAFRYVAPYFGISLFLSVAAAWIANRSKFGLLLSAICISLSMGIYQAYVPVTIGIFLLMLMQSSLEEKADFWGLMRKGVFYCSCLVLGTALYFLGLKICLAANPQVTLDTYKGVNNMGHIALSRIPSLIKKTWTYAVFFPLKNHYSLAPTRILQVVWMVVISGIGCLSVYVLFTRRIKLLPGVFFCLMALLFPIGVNFIEIMCPDSLVYTLMVYAMVLFACAPLLLMEYVPEERGKRKRMISSALGVALSVIVLYNGYYTNVNYTVLYYSNRQVENFAAGLVNRMQETEGYTPDKKWVFTWIVQDSRLYNIWQEAPLYGGVIGCSAKGLLRASYSFMVWFPAYVGVETPVATEQEKKAIEADPRFQKMPYWPSEGSVQVIDDYIVIKFPETESLW